MFNLLTVLGHTAAGKTAFAARLANRLDGEIISADSRQVYRGMDIGTGKDYQDYEVGDRRIPVHLIDIIDAGEEYNLYLFKSDFLRKFHEISAKGKLPVLCGGTGLYIESVIRNYRLLDVPPDMPLREELEKKSYKELVGILRLHGPVHNVTDTVNRKRLIRAIEIAMHQSAQPEDPPGAGELEPLILGIRFERSIRRKRITQRLRERLKEGMIEEVEELLRRGVSAEQLDYYGLEYRYVSKYLLKELTYEEMFNRLNTAIHQFAKRQMTYFRGMERRGIVIHWLEGGENMDDQLEQAVALFEVT